MEFQPKRGIAYCGMACVLCDYEGRGQCGGCKTDYNPKADDETVIQCAQTHETEGCFACGEYPCGGENDDCFTKQCARSKAVDGCFACGEYPCNKPWKPLENMRNKAFIRYAREFGAGALTHRLRENHAKGIVYHHPNTKPGESTGDYDVLDTQLAVYKLLRYGDSRAETERNPQITIEALTMERLGDYFDFFDLRAFTDNPPWAGCYCTSFQMTKEEEDFHLKDVLPPAKGGVPLLVKTLRELVKRQVETGKLQGYLAYIDGRSIGWCNANDRANLPSRSANGRQHSAPAHLGEKAVLCFEIAPEYRGRGVATALLSRVIQDAKAQGLAAVTAFPENHPSPGQKERNQWDFSGPAGFYAKMGFESVQDANGEMVMRLGLPL